MESDSTGPGEASKSAKLAEARKKRAAMQAMAKQQREAAKINRQNAGAVTMGGTEDCPATPAHGKQGAGPVAVREKRAEDARAKREAMMAFAQRKAATDNVATIAEAPRPGTMPPPPPVLQAINTQPFGVAPPQQGFGSAGPQGFSTPAFNASGFGNSVTEGTSFGQGFGSSAASANPFSVGGSSQSGQFSTSNPFEATPTSFGDGMDSCESQPGGTSGSGPAFSFGASGFSSSESDVSRFDHFPAPEGEAPCISTGNFHTVTKMDTFKELSIEQYHWLEYSNKSSLWQSMPQAKEEYAKARKQTPSNTSALPPPAGPVSASQRLAEARKKKAELAEFTKKQTEAAKQAKITSGGQGDKFEFLAAQESEQGTGSAKVNYHTITKVDAFKDMSVEMYHWQEHQHQKSLWQHSSEARQQCERARNTSSSSWAAVSSSGVDSPAQFRSFPAEETETGLPASTVNYHTVTKLEAFKELSIEQYHWLEYQNKASLWAHTTPAREQYILAQNGQATARSLFGGSGSPTMSTTNNTFGCVTPPKPFGSTDTPMFESQDNDAMGGSSSQLQPTNPTPFGSANGFGNANSNVSGNAFGSAGNAFGSTGNAFGNAGNAFGNAGNAFGNTGNAFGNTGNTFGNASNAFGNTNNAFGNVGNAFGNTGNAGNSFGNTGNAVGNAGNAGNTGNTFGSAGNTGNAFGNAGNTGNAFGGANTFSTNTAFGDNTNAFGNAKGGAFGNTSSTGNSFGNTSNTFGNPAGNSFGQTAPSGNAFGNATSTTSTTTGNPFPTGNSGGNSASSSNAFGNANTSSASNAFGTSSATGTTFGNPPSNGNAFGNAMNSFGNGTTAGNVPSSSNSSSTGNAFGSSNPSATASTSGMANPNPLSGTAATSTSNSFGAPSATANTFGFGAQASSTQSNPFAPTSVPPSLGAQAGLGSGAGGNVPSGPEKQLHSTNTISQATSSLSATKPFGMPAAGSGVPAAQNPAPRTTPSYRPQAQIDSQVLDCPYGTTALFDHHTNASNGTSNVSCAAYSLPSRHRQGSNGRRRLLVSEASAGQARSPTRSQSYDENSGILGKPVSNPAGYLTRKTPRKTPSKQFSRTHSRTPQSSRWHLSSKNLSKASPDSGKTLANAGKTSPNTGNASLNAGRASPKLGKASPKSGRMSPPSGTSSKSSPSSSAQTPRRVQSWSPDADKENQPPRNDPTGSAKPYTTPKRANSSRSRQSSGFQSPTISDAQRKRGRAGECSPSKSGVTYTLPSMEYLNALPESELKQVPDFELGVHGVASIQFLSPVDLRGVDLEKAVKISGGSICLYPSEHFPLGRPAAGQGLNQAAVCAIYNVWPKKWKALGGNAQTTAKKFEARLRDVPDTKFLMWEPASGKWSFRVEAGQWF